MLNTTVEKKGALKRLKIIFRIFGRNSFCQFFKLKLVKMSQVELLTDHKLVFTYTRMYSGCQPINAMFQSIIEKKREKLWFKNSRVVFCPTSTLCLFIQ